MFEILIICIVFIVLFSALKLVDIKANHAHKLSKIEKKIQQIEERKKAED